MIQFLTDIIDQLDLALDQLSIHDRNFDRFALLLVDNVVELTLQSYAREKAAENEYFGKLEEPIYDTKLIKKARSRSFNKKATAARDLGLIDDKHCTSLLHLHSFRNTAYHQGQRHETILHSLAIFYFINACDLLLKYEPGFWYSSSQDSYSYRACKYLGSIKSIDPRIEFKSAFTRLQEVVDSLDFDLVASLSSDMESTIDDTDEMISFLATDSTKIRTRNEVIVYAQSRLFAFTERAREFARKNGCTEKTINSYVEWLAKNYSWRIKTDPIDSWRNRLTTLRQQTNNHEALKRYCDFMNQTTELRFQIDDAASALDSDIQQRVDHDLLIRTLEGKKNS